MAQRGRDPRLNRRRQEDYYFEHEVAANRGRCFRGRPSRATATGHPRPTAAQRFSEGEVAGGNYRAGRKAEKYDYGHRRDRSRSPFPATDSPSDYSKKQQCETESLLQKESIQITVGNDKFRSPFPSRLQSEEDAFDHASITAVSKASAHDRHDYADETPSVTRAREMALRTREMLSKLTGWTPLSLQPLSDDHVNTTERPNFINISNSAYTKVSASNEVAQSILRNISAVAAAFCPKESGGVAHIKYKSLGKMRKSTTDDDDKFLYGEQLIPQKVETALSGLSGANESQLKRLKSSSEDHSLSLAEPSNRKANDGECDPVVANVLKSIGFNFELSKIMQEKAKKEREENEKNRALIKQASSFLAKQLTGPSQDNNVQDVSTDDSEALTTRHIGDDSNETLRRKDAGILYDDFSNSEDEFSGTEKRKWTASSSKSELSGVAFPPGVPSSVSLLTTPPPRHSLVATVQPQPPSVVLPLQASSLFMPPLPANSQPVLQPSPSWPAYQMPLTTGTLPKWKPKVSHVADEVEWEQNTQEFLRKLQEPRTAELPPSREAGLSRSRSPSSRSASYERVKKEQQKKRSVSKEIWSSSHEPKTKRQCTEKVKIAEHRRSCDQDTKVKRLSFQKERLSCLKEEHGQLMSIRQKSTHTKEKLKLNRRQQDELQADIRSLVQEINGRSTEGRSGFLSDDEHSFGCKQQREHKVMAKQRRYHRRNSKEESREREEKKSSFMHRERYEEKKELSSKVMTDKKSRLIDCSLREEMLSTGCPIENKLMNVEVKTEESLEITKELESKKEITVKKSANNHGKCYVESVVDEVKEESSKRTDEKSLEDKRETRSKDELQRSKMIRYDYYDGGDNWCSICSSLFPKLSEFLDHLHCTVHQQVVASKQTSLTDKPWKLLQVLQSKPHNNLPPVSAPASGMEFLLPLKGFFCTLCQKFSGDSDDAELHVLSEEHNTKFKQHCSDNPAYQKGFHSAKMEKITVQKRDKEKTTKEGQIERNLMSCVTDIGNNCPVTRQITHIEKRLIQLSNETTTVNSAKRLNANVLTRKVLPLENNLDQNPDTVNEDLLNQANESFANVTKETASVSSGNTMCNPVVSKKSDLACISETLLSSEISEVENFHVHVKASSKREPAFAASLLEETDMRLEESLTVEEDTVMDIDNRNPTVKPADTGATEQTDLNIHLVQAPISRDCSEAASNESLRNLKMQRTVCMLDPVVSCDITDLNAKCSTDTFVKVTVMAKALPVAMSEVQSVVLQLDSNTRNKNVYEPAIGGDVSQYFSPYISHVELDEKKDHATCQTMTPSSTERKERDNPAICPSQKLSSTEAEEMEDATICQSQRPSSTEAEEKEDHAMCKTLMALSTETEEREDPAICQTQKPSSTETEEREDPALCQTQKPSSTETEEREDPALCQTQKPSSTETEEREDPALCQTQKPSSTETEERDDPAICQSHVLSSTETEDREDPAICQSHVLSSTETEDREDPAICQTQKPSSTETEERDDPAICQTQKPSSTETEERDDPAICQTQKPSSTETEERDDPAICQTQKPSSTETEERDDPAICQTQKPSSTETEERDDPTICQAQKPSSTETEERDDPALCQTQKPSSSEIEKRDDPTICQSREPSSTETEEREDPAKCHLQKPLPIETEEKKDSAMC